MFAFIVVALAGIGIFAKQKIDQTSTSKALKVGFAKIEELSKLIEEERGRGIQLKDININSADYKPQMAEEVRIDPSGVIQVKFQNSITELGGKWVFFLPAIRGQGTLYSYLNMAQEKYDMNSPLTWICGVIQYNMPDRNYLPENCRYILGPEFSAPH